MAAMDQVQHLSTDPPCWQLHEYAAPCAGQSTCTDNVGKMIVFRETGRKITTRQFRLAARPGNFSPCRGLTPTEFLRGLKYFGVKKYYFKANVNTKDVATAARYGIVCVGVGYWGYPIVEECDYGGKTDLGFRGPHAVAGFGQRGSEVWVRDPDHHFDGIDANGQPAPRWDRFAVALLHRAMRAIVGNGAWKTTFMVAKAA